ncbi:MAG: D-glucuronyl C5-epimerase family protein, partial [Chloroflexota bacterium]|nr:D-glucuronyl C5-epimerase family protein [Chloroflexota bacterium]
FWSLYEWSGTRMMMLASPFYHRLHIVQLRVMHRLTGELIFDEYARRWQAQLDHPLKRTLALAYKGVFKLLYY